MSSTSLASQAEQFLRLQRRRRIEAPGRDVTLVQLIESFPKMDPNWIKEAVGNALEGDEAIMDQAVQSFGETLSKLNGFNQAKRLFTLETLAFLSSQEAITELMSNLSDPDEARRLAMSILLSFEGTDRVTSKVIERTDLFNERTKDSQIHGMVTFRFEMAESLLELIDPKQLSEEANRLKIDPDLSLDLLRQFLKNRALTDLALTLKPSPDLGVVLAKTIGNLQGHKSLPIYAKKRFDYLRDFYVRLLEPGRFMGVDGADLAKICAAFLWTNRQLIPPTSLIKKMTDVVSYGLPSTKLELAKFLETLAPTTLDALIKDLKDLFSKLLKEPYPDLAQLFANAKAKYEKGVEDKSLLGQVFSGLMDLKFQGLLVIHEVEGFIGKLVSEISGNEAAIKDLEDCFNEAPGIEGIEAPLILDKDDNFSRLLRKMKPVKTSVVGFRGYKQGGGLRATAANSRLIGGMAELDRFKDGMELLLKHMSKKGVFLDHCRYKPPQFTKEINESHATYLARDAENEPILLCFGITYLEPDGTIKAKDENKLDELLALQIQPYYFTMLTGNFSPVLHVRSRKLELDEGNEDQEDSGYEATLDMLEFKAIDLNHLQAQKTAASFMLAAFHFLPDNLWRSPDVQGAIALLFDKLKLIP